MNRNLLVLIASVLYDQSLRCDSTLTLVQKPTFVRALWHKVGRAESDQNCDEAFEEEYIAPFMDNRSRNAPRRNSCKTKIRLAGDA